MQTQNKITISILGASGYSGAELLRLLEGRSDVRIAGLFSGSSAGAEVEWIYPRFAGRGLGKLLPITSDPAAFAGTDLVFCALPSGEAMRFVPDLLDAGPRVIDLGGDFRLRSAEEYESWYRRPHTAPGRLGTAVYGLTEIYRERIVSARLVANPGCYPTSAILPLAPLLWSGIIAPEGIVINSLSGVSGAGRSASLDMSFAEVNENARPYKIGRHQHVPEIEMALSEAAGKPVRVSFTPHLIPVTRGILTTTHAELRDDVSAEEARNCLASFYEEAPFVRVLDSIPEIKNVTYTNYCDIGCAVDARAGKLVLVSAIDNLVKGAAGQAIQNMNIQFGLPEQTGLL